MTPHINNSHVPYLTHLLFDIVTFPEHNSISSSPHGEITIFDYKTFSGRNVTDDLYFIKCRQWQGISNKMNWMDIIIIDFRTSCSFQQENTWNE